ncbi:MAG: hypothetical protein OEM38_02935 [Gammaproteobacteria bacterium]|nr:hypothetical protein [Gammaproteobacteria bacterium]
MGQLYYKEASEGGREEAISMDDKVYREPNSVHISDDWDTIMEDFLDDFEDYQDTGLPPSNDDY